MTDEQVKEITARAEMEYEMLKDRVHDLYDKNVELQQKIDKAINYIKNCTMGGDNVYVDNIELGKLLEILGDKENE